MIHTTLIDKCIILSERRHSICYIVYDSTYVTSAKVKINSRDRKMFIGYQRMVLGERTDYKETQRIFLKRWKIFYTLITMVFIQL